MNDDFDFNNSDDTSRKEEFLKEYKLIVCKYGVYIGSCGCCNNPWVNVADNQKEFEQHLDDIENKMLEGL